MCGFAAFAWAATALLAHPGASVARGSAPFKTLVAARVSDEARQSMSPDLWTKLVGTYVGGTVVPFPGDAAPTLADCRRAAADYAVDAPFELRPRLPGLENGSGRVAAKAHIVVTNCITGNTIFDQTIAFDSDPPSNADAGDFEAAPDISWGRSVPATFAKFPLAFARIARVTNVNEPFVTVDIHDTGAVLVGDGLRDFETSDRKPRTTPIVLTVAQVFPTYVQCTYLISGEKPANGDLVEALPRATAVQQAPATATPAAAAVTPASPAPPNVAPSATPAPGPT